MNNFLSIFFLGLLVMVGIVTLLWLFSLYLRDSSIADIFWGSGFVVLAWFYFFLENPDRTRGYALLALATIWGLRLTIHLAIRNIGKGEDYRYAQWRQEHGNRWWWRSFFQVFLLQGFILWFVAALYVPALQTDQPWKWSDTLGVLLWSIGFFFEAVGDWQLMQFKKNASNKGKVLNTGLWRYSRHPNYFGDALLWWGFFCFALAHPWGYAFVVCPLLMTFLLLKVSGVSLLEQKLTETKPKYAEYIRRTPAFFPWWPRF